MMYEELLIGLRGHAKRKGCDDRCPCYDAENRGYATCSEELAQKAADAIEELQAINQRQLLEIAVLSKPRWIPVTERLPEPDVPCLCWCKGGTYGQIRWYGLYYLTSHRTWAFYDNDYTDNKEVTHWMYRPEPPKEVKDERI